MRWVVTGGCGFIGSALVRALVRDGAAVRVLDDLSEGRPENLELPVILADVRARVAWQPGRVELYRADIRDRATAMQVAAGADVIAHLAARTGVDQSVADPTSDFSVNVVGTLTLLECARVLGVPRFVLASSGAPIGEVEPPLHEDVPCRPVSPYGASKLACEGYCSAYFRSFGLGTVCLRFGNVYGPGSTHKNSVVARFIRRARTGEPLEIYGDGGHTRDYVYVEDLVDALLAAGTTPGAPGEIFQIATERETTVAELAELLCAALARFGLTGTHTVHRGARVGDVRRSYADTRKARKQLGWQARTPLSVGLEHTVRWFLAS